MSVKLNIRNAPSPELNSINVNPSLPGPVGVLRVDAMNSRKSIVDAEDTEDESTDCDEDGGEEGDCEITLG